MLSLAQLARAVHPSAVWALSPLLHVLAFVGRRRRPDSQWLVPQAQVLLGCSRQALAAVGDRVVEVDQAPLMHGRRLPVPRDLGFV